MAYSSIKNVQYLIAGLKSYGIDTVVVSPGNSHNAIVRSLEEDSFFKTYNIVDERSAAFFACGLIQEQKKPIAICCTSGTAASNYLTGVTEANRRGLPLVVITGDKNPYYLAQYEDQMIETPSIFKEVTRKQALLPIVENAKDAWYCQRIINEALLELDHHGTGAVHINVPIEEGMLAIDEFFGEKELPNFRKISRHSLKSDDLRAVFESIKDKKIFVMCGQDDHIDKRKIELVEKIAKQYNCIFATDKLSNLHCYGSLEVTRVAKAFEAEIAKFAPDILISIDGNPCMDVKFKFKNPNIHFEHWIVNEEGRIADPFKKLTAVFEGDTLDFLEQMASVTNVKNNSYLELWSKANNQVAIPDFEYSNLYATEQAMINMPKNSNFNIANSTTIRIAQYFDLDESIQVYCNRGVNGIDGCASTFAGQVAASPDKLNYLIIGDLTFFYDMNSIWNRYIGKNARIMLVNNEGAALFHFNQGTKKYPTLNENVAAEHFATAKGWVESQGFKYLSATNKEEFDTALKQFNTKNSDQPIFFEVFTHKDVDAKMQHDFYDKIAINDFSSAAKQSVKKIAKKMLGGKLINKLKK